MSVQEPIVQPAADWTTQQSGQLVSPSDLISDFSRTPVSFWMLAAVAVHVVVLGVTSLSYINDRWIDPEGAEQREQARKAANKPKFQPVIAETEKKDTPKSTAKADGDAKTTDAGTAKNSKKGDSAVEDRVSEKADEKELKELEKKFFGGDDL